jgi:isochorismate synthase
VSQLAALPRERDLLELELERAAARDGISVIALPAPAGSIASLVEHDGAVIAWEPRDGAEREGAWAGVGVAAEVKASGPRRFAELARAAAAVWGRVHADGPIAPRMFGGFAFADGAASAPPWRDFGDAWFVLPRWSYVRRGADAWWLLAVDREAARELRRWDAELAALELRLRAPITAPAGVIVGRDDGDRARWIRHVEDIRAAIADGAVDKIVAARPCTVELAQPASPGAVLARLSAAHAECTRYVFRRGDASFVGATPERLVRKRGLAVDGEALAGSIARAAADGPARLLASAKDRGEHAWVVRAIVEGLGRFCAQIDAPAEPRVRALRHIHHLHTPISGELAAPVHVLELAQALHPTPAVGGTPTTAALAWIAGREPAPRGWYAAPVGWFDAAGDGELVVAIRSGLLDGRRAHVWAGAGIVRDSDALAEWDEVALKQRALLGALGEP